MASEKAHVLLVGGPKPTIVDGLSSKVVLHRLGEAADKDAFLSSIADKIGGVAVSFMTERIGPELMQRLPKLKIVSTFGVGYDHVDAKWAGARGITVTNTPDVLNEEVADTALGLLLCTVRQLPQADRFVRSGQWVKGEFPHTRSTLRERTVGVVGLGRIGKVIARRLVASAVTVAYHARNPQPDVPYRYYADLIAMARDVDVLLVITPGGAGTKHLINAQVLEALGPEGILINVARGSVVDQAALIEALQSKKIYSAGLDVFADEPNVPRELIEMEQVVLLPHVGSASLHTRRAMDQLVVDNLLAWADGRAPLTPVAETPWRGSWS